MEQNKIQLGLASFKLIIYFFALSKVKLALNRKGLRL